MHPAQVWGEDCAGRGVHQAASRSQVSGTDVVGLRGDLVTLESRLAFLTYHVEETGNSSAACNLLSPRCGCSVVKRRKPVRSYPR